MRNNCSDHTGLLLAVEGWLFLGDLDRKLVFPSHIIDTLLRPNIIIFSNVEKIIIMIELTCPCEDNFDTRHEDKLDRYDGLKNICIKRCWKMHLFAVEVGACGYKSKFISGHSGNMLVHFLLCE